MIDYKGTKIVGVDMGYGNMKTAKTHFPTALREYPDKPTFPGDLLMIPECEYAAEQDPDTIIYAGNP